MKDRIFKISVALVALAFTFIFCWMVFPPFLENPDIVGAFGSGFVNPYASMYSIDAICCWIVLCIWVIYEYPKVKNGWICLLLGLMPGVAVGFAVYLIMRTNQLKQF